LIPGFISLIIKTLQGGRMERLSRKAGILIFLCFWATNAYAGFYPGIGSDVSFTDQNNTFYTLYGSLGYTPSYKTYMGIGYTHEWNFTQTTGTQEFHIINASLYQRLSRKWKIGGLASYTLGATANTSGYYSLLLRLDPRYAVTDKLSVGAGPLYYYVNGPGDFIGIFTGVYVYPTYNWFAYLRGTVDTSVDPDISQVDTALDIGTSYNINKYIGVYALYRLSTGITTYPANNLYSNNSGNTSAKGSMSTMAMGGTGSGMTGSSGTGSMNHNPSISYTTNTISTVTLGLAVTF
jgi:hypothetical protein